MEQTVGSNALRFVGEMFLPGASQYASGNIGSGIAHSLAAAAAGGLLIGTGVAPLLGTLAVIGVKLDSYSSATTGRSLLNIGADALREAEERFETKGERERETKGEREREREREREKERERERERETATAPAASTT